MMRRTYVLAACLVTFLAWATTTSAQRQSGQIFGQVTDATGAALPNVKVTITSTAELQPITVTTGDTGSYRFADIPIGTYSVKFEANGYAAFVQEGVQITIGFTAEVNAQLKLASVAQTVEVNGTAPVIDVQNTTETSDLSEQRLQDLPTAHGEYNIAEQSPGVQGPAKDIGGSTNGNQTYFVSRGADGNQTRYYLDGVDLAPAGSYTGFWVDYDTLQEASVTEGGADPEVQTSGLAINMVSKGGSDTLHGSFQYAVEGQSFEANNLNPSLRQAVALPGTSAGNPLQHFTDFGGQIGGPIKKGRLWFWAAYGQNVITVGDDKLYATGGNCPAVAADPLGFAWGTVRSCEQSDASTLRHLSYKIGWQVFHNNTFTFENIYGTKEEPHFLFGPTVALDSTINLSEHYTSASRGPRFWDAGWTPLWRFDDQQIINDRWVADVSFIHFGKQNTFGPQNPSLLNTQVQFDQGTGEFRAAGEIAYQNLSEPMNTIKAASSYFIPGKWGGSHTIKFGYLWSRYENWGMGDEGGGAEAIFNETTAGAPAFSQPLAVNFYRPSVGDAFLYEQAGWFLDTYTHKRLTLNLGIRWDRQWDMERAESVPASIYEGEIMSNGVSPFNWLPAVQYPGANGGVTWDTFAPRLGAAYDLFGTGKTVLKASFAQYFDMRTAGELAGTYDTVGVPNGNGAPSLSFIQFPWNDANGDGIVEMNEVGTTFRTFGNNYNPANPANTTSPNAVSPNIKDPKTNEITAGVSQELAPGFALTVTYVYRRYSDFIWKELDGITSADFTSKTLTPTNCPSRTAPIMQTDCATATYYVPTVQLPSAYTLENEPDYYRTYHGLEIQLAKRMTKSWMLNGSLTFQSTRQYWSAPDAYQDPTNIAIQNGAQYAPPESASSGFPVNIPLNARWITRFGARYILPWYGIAVSAVNDFRQGYPIESTINVASRPDGAASVAVLINPPGVQRFSNLEDMDIRVDKDIAFNERFHLEPSLDIYNLFNANPILGQQPNQNAANANYIGYVLSPRIARLGIKFSF